MNRIHGIALGLVVATQAVVPQPTRPATIQTRLVMTFGDDDGPGAFGTAPSAIARMSDGRMIITEFSRVPVVFDASGRYLKPLGVSGQGPGEFGANSGRTIRVGSGDTVLVSNQLPTINVFGPDLRYVRSMRIGPDMDVGDFLRLGSGFVVSRRFARGQIVDRLAFVDSLNRLVRTFGPETLATPMAIRSLRLFPGDARHYWTQLVTSGLHEIVRWSIDGRRVGAIAGKPTWWPKGEAGAPPGAHIGTVRQVQGRVWINNRVSAPDAPKPQSRGEASVRQIQWEKLFNSHLEVYDVASGRLLADLAVSGFIFDFLDDSHFVRYIVDARDIPRLEIWEMKIKP